MDSLEKHFKRIEKYETDKEKYSGWQRINGEVFPLMNPDYLTKNNLWQYDIHTRQ